MVQMDCETDSIMDENDGPSDKETCGFSPGFGGLESLAMTSSLCRLFILIERWVVLFMKLFPKLGIYSESTRE